MASVTEDTYPDEDCTQDCDGPSIDPQYIADRERDIRMCCLRTALDTFQHGMADASTIISTAQDYLNFLNGSAK